MNAITPHTVDILNVNFINEIAILQEPVFQNMKCLADSYQP